MAKQTEAQKKAHNKYRTEKQKGIAIQWPTAKHEIVMAYAKHINMPAITWIKKLIFDAISSDPTFTYTPEEEDLRED